MKRFALAALCAPIFALSLTRVSAAPLPDRWLSERQTFSSGGVANICVHDGAVWWPRADGMCHAVDKPKPAR